MRQLVLDLDAFGFTVRDEGDVGAARAQVARRLLAHLARADEEDRAAGEVAEDLLGKRGGGGRDGGRALADRRLRTHLAARVQRLAKDALEEEAGRAGLERRAHLAEDLAFARHERVEPG